MSKAFQSAVKAIEKRDLPALEHILSETPAVAKEKDKYKRTLLLYASTTGDINYLKPLLEAGCPIDGPGDTALQWAASENHLEVCKFLVSRGASLTVNKRLASGGTPLVQALFYGHTETAEYLASLELAPNNLRVAAGLGKVDHIEQFFNPSGKLKKKAGLYRKWYRANDEFPERPTTSDPQEVLDEALCYACFNNRLAAARLLVKRGANPNSKPHYATALHFAVSKNNMELVDTLLESGADPFIKDDCYSSTPIGWVEWSGDSAMVEHLVEHMKHKDLRVAVMTGDTEIVKTLLSETGTDVLRGEIGEHALVQTIENGNEELEILLRKHGAKISLPVAALLDRESEVRELLEAGVHPDSTMETSIPIPCKGAQPREVSALLLAAIHRKRGICEILLKAGAFLDMYCAAALNDTSRVQQLLDEGFPVDQEDEIGRTPLHRAIQGGALDVARLLIEQGADLDKPSDFYSFGPRAIHVAAEAGADQPMLELLVEKGADLNACLNTGTPLDCALRSGNDSTVELLKKLGATKTAFFSSST